LGEGVGEGHCETRTYNVGAECHGRVADLITDTEASQQWRYIAIT